MAIPESERTKMLAGPAFAGRESSPAWKSIGITRLLDLADRDPDQLVHEVNIAAGRPIWHPPIATHAMTNLIAAALHATPTAPTASEAGAPASDARSRPSSDRR